MTKSLVLIGSGPGIGRHVAAEFASHGFRRIGLVSRNGSRLKSDATFVSDIHGAPKDLQVQTYPTDVTDPEGLQRTLKQIGTDLGPPEVVVFNAARVEPTTLNETGWERVLEDFKTTTLALYIVSNWCIPHLLSLAESGEHSSVKPSLLVTLGGLHAYPLPPFFSLSMAKASQHSLTEMLALVYRPQGINVGTVDVRGQVTNDDVDGPLGPVTIAREIWQVYDQKLQGREVGTMTVFEGLRGLKKLPGM